MDDSKMTMEEKLAKARGETEVMRTAVRHANKGLDRLAHKVKRLRTKLEERDFAMELVLPKAIGAGVMKNIVTDLFDIISQVAAAQRVDNEAAGVVEVSIPQSLVSRIDRVAGATQKKEVASAN